MWSLSCDNPEAIGRLFDSVVDLDQVDLHELVLQRDGPRLQLRFELPRFPDHPPARWHADANAVQVTVDLWLIEDLALKGWQPSNVGVFALTPSPEGLHVSFIAPDVSLRARCAFAHIARVSEYSVSEPDTDTGPPA